MTGQAVEWHSEGFCFFIPRKQELAQVACSGLAASPSCFASCRTTASTLPVTENVWGISVVQVQLVPSVVLLNPALLEDLGDIGSHKPSLPIGTPRKTKILIRLLD